MDAADLDLGGSDADDASDAGSNADGSGLAPKAQLIVTGCWLTMKEAALVMGTLARSLPRTGEVTSVCCAQSCLPGCRTACKTLWVATRLMAAVAPSPSHL